MDASLALDAPIFARDGAFCETGPLGRCCQTIVLMPRG